MNNAVASPSSFIGAGSGNSISSSPEAAIVAGQNNRIENSPHGFIGSGSSNLLSGALDGVIGGGTSNSVAVPYGAIGGGSNNRIYAAKPGGGLYGFIGGGYQNTVTGTAAVVTGGEGNVASGDYAAIPGGYHNLASGTLSFAAGYGAQALAPGTFVWADYSVGAPHLSVSTPNSFVARASGGITFWSNNAQTIGVTMTPGSGTWASVSDRRLKTNVTIISDAEIVNRLRSVPVTAWSYTSEPGIRHIGPMAQDFYKAFGLSDDDRHITAIDEEGTALAALKAIDAQQAERGRNLRTLEVTVRTLRTEVRNLNAHRDNLRKSGVGLKATTSTGPCSGAGPNSFIANTHGNSASAAQSSVAGGSGNTVCDDDSTVSGGQDNVINSGSDNGLRSFIGAGQNGLASSADSFIGAGVGNTIASAGADSAIVSGSQNTMSPSSVSSPASNFIGAGESNNVPAQVASDPSVTIFGGSANSVVQGSRLSGTQNTIIGGLDNSIESTSRDGPADTGAIGGGLENVIPSGFSDTITGGDGNSASGFTATIVGGYHNFVSVLSLAGGFACYDAFGGSFLWGDFSNGATHLRTTKANQFLVRASGGVRLFSNSGSTVGVNLAPGSGSWSSSSDRSLKTAFSPVDGPQVLARLRSLPILEWSYSSSPHTRHVGPMAQDFYRAYGLGVDNRHVTSIDEDGIAIAAIKELILRGDRIRAEQSKVLATIILLEVQLSRMQIDATRLAPPPRTTATPVPCTGSSATSFLANDQGNAAVGIESSVIGGTHNFSCEGQAIVFSGIGNLVDTGNSTGPMSAIGGGSQNVVSAPEAYIGAGSSNTVSSAMSAIICGIKNIITQASGAFLGGGSYNAISGALSSVVGGGSGNDITAFRKTTMETNGSYNAFIGGGSNNRIDPMRADGGMYASIIGGNNNEAEGEGAAIGGGQDEERAGYLAAAPGGDLDSANGALSFSAGMGASADAPGAFAWNDFSGTSLAVKTTNQMVIHASGGSSFFSNAAATSGVSLPSGGGSWTSLSDRFAKSNIVALDFTQLLSAAKHIPVNGWSYRTERRVRHIGPTAQDFTNAFHVGEDDRHIAVIDEDGVVLAMVHVLTQRSDASVQFEHTLTAQISMLRKLLKLSKLR